MNYDELYDRLRDLDPSKEEIRIMMKEARESIGKLSSKEERKGELVDAFGAAAVGAMLIFIIALFLLYLVDAAMEFSNAQMEVISICLYVFGAVVFVVLLAVLWGIFESERKAELEKFTTALYALQNYATS